MTLVIALWQQWGLIYLKVMLPYVRIVPMHMTIILGAWLGGAGALPKAF